MKTRALPIWHRRLVAIAVLLLIFLAGIYTTDSSANKPDYAWIFGVGHNSGRSLAATNQALFWGADILEIDVRSLDGVLVSAHLPVLDLGNLTNFTGPTVEEVWNASAEAEIIMLDLKEADVAYLTMVSDFLATHPTDQQVIIGSPSPAVLKILKCELTDVILLLSVSTQASLDFLRSNPDLANLVDGVAIRHALLDQPAMDFLLPQDLFVIAWIVNDLARVDELIELGVGGITTDNLEIMKLLGGDQHGERDLVRRISAATSITDPTTRSCT